MVNILERQTDVSELAPAVLRRFGDAVALVEAGLPISFAELAERIEARSADFGPLRRLICLVGANTADFAVSLLAALDGGHPTMIVPDRTASGEHPIIDAYTPDIVVEFDGDIVHHTERDVTSPHDLHPDLAVLLSTSGSTGGQKLVRISRGALEHNALAIAAALGIESRDRAITALPMQYCYGLSVLTSHLAVGASVVLTDTSVVDPCFWDAVRTHGVTSLAAVPYTFDLLDRVGPEVFTDTNIRSITQAGGRLAPDDVERWATVGRKYGWDLHVMYGQTEATARIACLAPDELAANPRSVGRAIPGGHLRIDRDDHDLAEGEGFGPGVGPIVYSGPNVMMGYAAGPDDLALPHEVAELRTGDLGRFDDEGRLEIVGRASRFLKIHGKRVDLDDLQEQLADRDWVAWCTGTDDRLVVATIGSPEAGTAASFDDDLLAAVSRVVDVPRRRILAIQIDEVPRTDSGKVDHPALVRLAQAADELRRSADDTNDAADDSETVAETFAVVFGVDQIEPTDSFARLGGDSFSYVEVSIRLEATLGELPVGWHLMSVAELEERRRTHTAGWLTRWTRQLETSVVIRAIGIALIVCTHMRIFRLAGGAHTLLAVLGFNFARFQLLDHDVPDRLRRAATTIGRIAVPTSAWIGLNMLIAGGYSLGAMFLVNNYTGSAFRRDGRWEYWYFETFVQVMIVLFVVFSVGAVRRTERRAPFAFALGILGLTWLFRFEIIEWGGSYNAMFRTHTVASFIALGWCAQRASNFWQRALVTACTVVTAVGYFGQTDRELRIIVLVSALIWIPSIRLPRPVAEIVAKVAAASMWIFLVHWQIWPALTPWLNDRFAYVLTMAAGVGVWFLIERIAVPAFASARRRA